MSWKPPGQKTVPSAVEEVTEGAQSATSLILAKDGTGEEGCRGKAGPGPCHQLWKQPRCPRTDEWIKKMWSIHTVEYSSVIKKSEVLPFAMTWMHLEGIMLSETSQRKTNTIQFCSCVEFKKQNKQGKIRQTKNNAFPLCLSLFI